MKKVLLTLAVFLSYGLTAVSQTPVFEKLRLMADTAPADTVDVFVNETWAPEGSVCRYLPLGNEDRFIEGVVVSNHASQNTTASFNLHYTRAITTSSRRCLVLQSDDGKYGIRLDFEERYTPALVPQFHRARFNLKGGLLFKENGVYGVHGLTAASLLEISPAPSDDFVPKEVSLSEISDDDILTYITVKDCEFVFKDGAYINIYEKYGQATEPAVKGLEREGTMDGWASLLTDPSGGSLLMLLNCYCPWRRDGTGVPQGSGSISGILERPFMQRYGSVEGYGIRPTRREDIAFGDNSPWKTVAVWDWNREGNLFRTHRGTLKVEYPGFSVTRGADYNNPSINTPSVPGSGGDYGIKENGALKIVGRGSFWWDFEKDRGRGIVLDVNTRCMKGKNLVLAFTFSGGDTTPEGAAWFPVWWGVEYSLDRKHFTRAKAPDAEMRSLPWSTFVNNVAGDSTYGASLEAGMGMTDHLFRLPAALLGRRHVYIRIAPSRKIVRSLSPRYSDSGALTPDLQADVTVQFGTIKLMYD